MGNTTSTISTTTTTTPNSTQYNSFPRGRIPNTVDTQQQNALEQNDIRFNHRNNIRPYNRENREILKDDFKSKDVDDNYKWVSSPFHNGTGRTQSRKMIKNGDPDPFRSYFRGRNKWSINYGSAQDIKSLNNIWKHGQKNDDNLKKCKLLNSINIECIANGCSTTILPTRRRKITFTNYFIISFMFEYCGKTLPFQIRMNSGNSGNHWDHPKYQEINAKNINKTNKQYQICTDMNALNIYSMMALKSEYLLLPKEIIYEIVEYLPYNFGVIRMRNRENGITSKLSLMYDFFEMNKPEKDSIDDKTSKDVKGEMEICFDKLVGFCVADKSMHDFRMKFIKQYNPKSRR